MRQVDLIEHVEPEPFQPFRIHLSTGAFFDITHPNSVDVGHSTLTIGLPVQEGHQRFVQIALVHIVWVEVVLPTP
jgi:hypothetical protein